jgi:hypothetical protein
MKTAMATAADSSACEVISAAKRGPLMVKNVDWTPKARITAAQDCQKAAPRWTRGVGGVAGDARGVHGGSATTATASIARTASAAEQAIGDTLPVSATTPESSGPSAPPEAMASVAASAPAAGPDGANSARAAAVGADIAATASP